MSIILWWSRVSAVFLGEGAARRVLPFFCDLDQGLISLGSIEYPQTLMYQIELIFYALYNLYV